MSARMRIAFRTLRLQKEFPLTISRGTSAGSENLFVSATRGGVTGWGEAAPGIREGAKSAAQMQTALAGFCESIDDGDDWAVMQIHDRARERGLPACAIAALDIALWDRLARAANLPLHTLLGLGKPRAPTSMTIGINPPEVVRERAELLLARGARALKIKLGSPDGAEADRAMFAQAAESARGRAVSLRVDANGGWDVADARAMMKWLAERGAEYVEQPLAEGREEELPALYKNRPLPLFVDESCRFAEDLPKWAHAVDGVNIKLMKCGGVSGALRILAAARAFGLKTMIGCMSESSMSISAAAALGGALDHIDLDSQLNLAPDPCRGAEFVDGVVMPNGRPGHGAEIVHAE
ncbi:MAG: dipeptide epimerase [Gammaproteobacteria bacterium]|nr:dipeptide epimerase [Gammaproteobacteria bacterium]MDA7962209.1 dipeptide epimerase [Gammaproteobacteria bacterium]MDA7970076.1 dipeptide epimerase [Gammaproteobacteria bacterium]MDA8024268.1 dipeptide epimerase [Gammaproteobacteria bacterium]